MYVGPRIIDTDAARPAGKPEECFYCKRPAGTEHAASCTYPLKTVVCRVIVEYVREVPNCWSQQQIDFHMNKSSSCTDNLIDEMGRVGNCTCRQVTGVYLREATGGDEIELGYASRLNGDRPSSNREQFRGPIEPR